MATNIGEVSSPPGKILDLDPENEDLHGHEDRQFIASELQAAQVHHCDSNLCHV